MKVRSRIEGVFRTICRRLTTQSSNTPHSILRDHRHPHSKAVVIHRSVPRSTCLTHSHRTARRTIFVAPRLPTPAARSSGVALGARPNDEDPTGRPSPPATGHPTSDDRPRVAIGTDAHTTTTVSSSEVDHFNRLGSTWWHERGSFGLLHQMNPIRVQFIKDRLSNDRHFPLRPTRPRGSTDSSSSDHHHHHPPDSFKFLTHRTVLDVGSGGGIFSEALARLGAQVLGIDAAEDSTRAARLHARSDPHFHPRLEPSSDSTDPSTHPNPSLVYRCTSAEALLDDPTDPHRERYDLVCAMEVIEHVDHPFKFLTTLAELTKPGGHIVLSTISRTPVSRLLAITLAESGLPLIGIVPAGTHTYSKFIKPQELVDFFRQQLGWAQSHERSDLEIRGCLYNPLTSTWKLLPRDALSEGWCNYFLGVRKPL